MKNRNQLFLLILILLFVACTKKDRFSVDISKSDVSLEIKRLDRDLFEVNFDDLTNSVLMLNKKYGDFFVLYNLRVVSLGLPTGPAYPDNLLAFITDYTINNIYEQTKLVFPDLKETEKQLNDAFRYYHYYFPDRKIPAIYTFIGGFNQSVVVADSMLAIGLDKYLGTDCEFYKRLETPNYLKATMYPEKIPTDALKAWALTEFVYNDSVDNLVNNMIYQGKMQYFLDAVFPETPDTLKFGMTSLQLEWCKANEKQMWNNLIDQKLIFTTDYMTINKYINPAPFTSGFPKESPGRAVVWIGYKIVKKYMDRNPRVTIEQLMLNDQYQKILSESRYEP